MLQRMHDRGDRPTLRLKMEAKFLPDAESANVVAELRGSEKPDEVVVLAGHYDSWDVGQGAHDDGGGCIIAWEAVRFDRIFKGDDWRGTRKGRALEERLGAVGVEVVYFPYTMHTSSTMLRRALMTRAGEPTPPVGGGVGGAVLGAVAGAEPA